MLRETSGSSSCEWKGQASYYDLVTDTRVAPKAARSYLNPSPRFEPLAGAVAVIARALAYCPQAMADAIHFVDANGLKFAYLEEGSGPLVLMLHGFPDTAHTWDDLRPRIAAKGYRAVSPFMRGYQPSGIPDRDPDQETLARDPVALIEALGAREAIIIGHDWGASAAYGAAALAPDRVKKLIAIGIPHPAAIKPSLKKLWGVRHFAA